MSTSYSKLRKDELLSTLQARDEQVATLQATMQELTDALADKAIAQTDEHIEDFDINVFDKVNRRSNPHGGFFNCRIAEDCERLNVDVAAAALGETLNGRHSPVRTDKYGRKWIDFYAAVPNSPSIQMEEAA